MSKKSKGVVLGSTTPFSGGGYEDAKARLKHQTLVEDYHELQREADVMRSKLEAARHRKLTLAAEVRFLRRRHKYLVETKSMDAFQEQEQILVQPSCSIKHTKNMNKQLSSRKRPPSVQHGLLPLPEPKPKKRLNIGKKEVPVPGISPVINRKKKLVGAKETAQFSLTPVSVLNYEGRLNITDGNLGVNCTSLKKSTEAFDLNQDATPSGKEVSLPTRAPIFDLNEISTGDEDFQSNVEEAVKFEEAKKNLIKGLNDEQQNELKLAICRNSGEGSSRVAKRKISWQDPVAILQV